MPARLRPPALRQPTPRRLPLSQAVALALGTSVSVTTLAAEAPGTTPTLPTVTVTGQVPGQSGYFGSAPDRLGTEYQVGREGIDLVGGPGGVNPYQAVAELPSVNAANIDPYGFANVPGGNKGLRVRGELFTHGANGSIEGLPLTGVNPGPGYLWLFDMENVASVSLNQGPIPADRNAFFTVAGVLDSRLRWPEEQAGGVISQSFGSHDFQRTFARVDSGRLADGSALFFSASYSDADKWRGPGQAMDGRTNAEFGWQKALTDRLDARVYYAWNDYSANNYRPLTYAQAQDLGTYRNFDYSSVSSATAAQAVNYYGYNRQQFTNQALLGELAYRLDERSRLVFKPFYTKEQGQYFDGQSNGKVRNWLMDHETWGFTGEYQTVLADTALKLGYWWTSLEPPGPPTAWKMYDPTASGDLKFSAWSLLAKVTDRHEFQGVYAQANRQLGALEIQGGLRYLREDLPGMDTYDTKNVGDVSYDQAISSSSGVVANRSVSGRYLDEWLPNLALGYNLSPGIKLKGSIGRLYGAPSFDVWPTFQQNSATFLNKGVTAQKLWDAMKPETADAVDLGVRFSLDRGYVEPTLFYSRNHNKSVSFFDPVVGAVYAQNVGESRATGAQLAWGYNPLSALELFGAASWTRSVFTGNLVTAAGANLAVDGLQLPDVPRLQASVGASWSWGGTKGGGSDGGAYRLSSVVHYMGERWADSLHNEKVGAYTTVDLMLGYQRRLPFSAFSKPITLDASLGVYNLFDEKYIGFINASYVQSSGQTSYYPGAPRTVVGKLSFSF